jgi:hypothetical protein
MISETALAQAQALRWLLARLQAKRHAQDKLRCNHAPCQDISSTQFP